MLVAGRSSRTKNTPDNLHVGQKLENKKCIADACGKEIKDIDMSCVDAYAPFICLKVQTPSQIVQPVPNTTLVFIALTLLNTDTGIFRGLNLHPGSSSVVSGDLAQVFEGGDRGGGLGIVVRIKFRSR